MKQGECIFCGGPVKLDPDYPDNVRVVHPSCALSAAVAECESRGLPVPDWMQALLILREEVSE